MSPKNSGFSNLIEVINKIQDACAEANDETTYDLPQIAVVGSQSAGKSSVLENIVGKDFLPRGTGVVTRRPLILQLICQPGDEYGVFLHKKDEKYTDFNKIRDEIEADTNSVAGSNKGICNTPISLRIYSPNVPTLTLVDLPGMTKVAIGDQPKDIEKQIHTMIMNFIEKNNCLILAVTPANSDLANSDALKLAREVDEKGERTIGVITKCDIMDDGTDCRDILENKVLRLRRGYVGVVNRSQKDIDERKSIQDALKAEPNFFENHPSYKTIANRQGTQYLQSILTQELGKHIQKNLTALQDKMEKKKMSMEKKIKQLTDLYPTDAKIMEEKLEDEIDKVKANFKKEIGDLGAESIETERLSMGTKINEVFFDSFPKLLAEITCDKEKIDFTIRNSKGIRSCSNTPHMAFELLVRKDIDRLEEPINKCIEDVGDLLREAVRMSTQCIEHYPTIRTEIESRIISHIYSDIPEQKNNVLALLTMEKEYQNTNHEDFKPKNDVEYQGALSIVQFIDVEGSMDLGKVGLCWFVLTSKSLCCYFNENHDVPIFTLPLDGYQMRTNDDKNIILEPNTNSNGQGCKYLELRCAEDDDVDSWKESLEWVIKKDPMKQGAMKVKRDVSECHEKVTKYMAIVKKTARDMVPKAIKLYIIGNLQKYIQKFKLDPELNLADLFGMDEAQAEELERCKQMLDNYKNALEKIRSSKTHSA